MKIRKTFVGNLPDNKIVNSNSTSETDTYSCKYLNERNVIVSSEEPTTGEEVWLKKGKNLFDKNSSIIQGKYLGDNEILNSAVDFYQDEYIKVLPNTSYVLSDSLSGTLRIVQYDETKGYISRLVDDTSGQIAFTTQSTTEYVRLSCNIASLDSIQLEQGDTETIHEEYIEPTIYTKNDNGAYEEFYKVGNYREYDVIYEGELLVGGTINLNNAKRFLDVYFSNVNYSLLGKYTIDTKLGTISWGSVVLLATDSATALEYYVDESSFDKTNKIFTHTRSGYFNISSGVYTGKNTAAYRVYRIETYN